MNKLFLFSVAVTVLLASTLLADPASANAAARDAPARPAPARPAAPPRASDGAPARPARPAAPARASDGAPDHGVPAHAPPAHVDVAAFDAAHANDDHAPVRLDAEARAAALAKAAAAIAAARAAAHAAPVHDADNVSADADAAAAAAHPPPPARPAPPADAAARAAARAEAAARVAAARAQADADHAAHAEAAAHGDAPAARKNARLAAPEQPFVRTNNGEKNPINEMIERRIEADKARRAAGQGNRKDSHRFPEPANNDKRREMDVRGEKGVDEAIKFNNHGVKGFSSSPFEAIRENLSILHACVARATPMVEINSKPLNVLGIVGTPSQFTSCGAEMQTAFNEVISKISSKEMMGPAAHIKRYLFNSFSMDTYKEKVAQDLQSLLCLANGADDTCMQSVTEHFFENTKAQAIADGVALGMTDDVATKVFELVYDAISLKSCMKTAPQFEDVFPGLQSDDGNKANAIDVEDVLAGNEDADENDSSESDDIHAIRPLTKGDYKRIFKIKRRLVRLAISSLEIDMSDLRSARRHPFPGYDKRHLKRSHGDVRICAPQVANFIMSVSELLSDPVAVDQIASASSQLPIFTWHTHAAQIVNQIAIKFGKIGQPIFNHLLGAPEVVVAKPVDLVELEDATAKDEGELTLIQAMSSVSECYRQLRTLSSYDFESCVEKCFAGTQLEAAYAATASSVNGGDNSNSSDDQPDADGGDSPSDNNEDEEVDENEDENEDEYHKNMHKVFHILLIILKVMIAVVLLKYLTYAMFACCRACKKKCAECRANGGCRNSSEKNAKANLGALVISPPSEWVGEKKAAAAAPIPAKVFVAEDKAALLQNEDSFI